VSVAWDALPLWPLLVVALAWPFVATAWRALRSRAEATRPIARLEFAAGAALALAGVALLGPRFGEGRERVEERGLDIAIALDVSRSMLAEDARPSRLSAAQADLLASSRDGRGDRWSLVLFAGEARRRVPLCDDRGAVAEIAALADPGDVSLGGTDLGAAIAAAVESLGEARGPQALVLLITDGEDPDGSGAGAAAAARELGVEVHVVGYGSELGARLPDGAGGFLQDAAGQPVLSRLNTDDLRALAAAGGGRFLQAESTGDPIGRWSNTALRAKRDRLRASEARAALGHGYGWPAALALLAAGALLAPGGGRRRG
jgi:Ca-activated chloride channel family protein